MAAEEEKRIVEMKALEKKRLEEEAAMVRTSTHVLMITPGSTTVPHLSLINPEKRMEKR